jgi:hypothetical protein
VDFNNNFYYYLMSSVLSWDTMQRIVAIPYDVSGQPIGSIFKGQEVQEEASRTANISNTSWRKPANTRTFLCVYSSFVGTCIQSIYFTTLIVKEAGPSGRAV